MDKLLMDQRVAHFDRERLPFEGGTYELEGQRYRDTGDSFTWVNMAPGSGVRMDKHPDEEIFIIEGGRARYTVEARSIESQAGQIIGVPAETARQLVSSGDQWLSRWNSMFTQSSFPFGWKKYIGR